MDPHTNYQQEIVEKIERFGGSYDPESHLSIEDQLLICETLIHSTPVDPSDEDGKLILRLREEEDKRNGGADVKGCVYGGCKRNAVEGLFESKNNIVQTLKTSKSRKITVVQISSLLENLFADYPTNKPGYWFDVARYYTLRQINWTLTELYKLSSPSHETVRNPAAYFTFLIKIRKKRIRRKTRGGV